MTAPYFATQASLSEFGLDFVKDMQQSNKIGESTMFSNVGAANALAGVATPRDMEKAKKAIASGAIALGSVDASPSSAAERAAAIKTGGKKELSDAQKRAQIKMEAAARVAAMKAGVAAKRAAMIMPKQ